MAISANTVWEIRTTGTANNVNGGGFVTGASGTDFSQQDAAQYNLTSVTTAAADAILLHASAAADMVGNIAHIISGTNFTAGWYEIISVVAGVSITLDRTCTSAAGALGVVNIGGAMSLASTLDDDLFESVVAGNVVHVKNGKSTNIKTANDTNKSDIATLLRVFMLSPIVIVLNTVYHIIIFKHLVLVHYLVLTKISTV